THMRRSEMIRTIQMMAACAVLLAATVAQTEAAAISLVDVRGAPASHGASSYDPVTGKFYTRPSAGGYNGDAAIFEFFNEALYVNHSGSLISNLDGGLFGTYFSVSDGKIFGRGDSASSTTITRWDAATGVAELTAA